MSSQEGSDTGLNAIMCYFPWYPYYQRYQIGFDILVNPTDAQADHSAAGPAPRVIHVRLSFPDGVTCNPANFSEMSPSSRGGAPHFLPPHPHFDPPMVASYAHSSSHYQGSTMWQRQQDARVIAYVVNGQPGEFMVIDDTPYDIIPECKECNEFHTYPQHIYGKGQDVSKRKSSQQQHQQSGHAHYPSASATTGEGDTSYAAPGTSSGRVSTDHKSQLKKEDNLTQQMADELQHGSDEGVQEKQGKIDTATSVSDKSSAATITEEMSRLHMSGQNSNGNVAEDDANVTANDKIDKDN